MLGEALICDFFKLLIFYCFVLSLGAFVVALDFSVEVETPSLPLAVANFLVLVTFFETFLSELF